MAILVSTPTAPGLLRAIKQTIDEKQIDTWVYDPDGDFTHVPAQWNKKAWFRPAVESDLLVFRILTPRGTTMSKTVYGVYHGRFIEMLLTHFDRQFERALATALAGHGDVVKG